jgi:hypothetical protein
MTMRFLMALALAAGVSACATAPAQRPLPPVTVAGPVFPASQFILPAAPLPPDPATAVAKAGSAAAHYESRLRSSDKVCRLRLGSIGRQLDAAGQVVRLKGAVRR